MSTVLSLTDLPEPLLNKADEVSEIPAGGNLFHADKNPQIVARADQDDGKPDSAGTEFGGKLVAVKEPGRYAEVPDETPPFLFHANRAERYGIQGAPVRPGAGRVAGVILDFWQYPAVAVVYKNQRFCWRHISSHSLCEVLYFGMEVLTAEHISSGKTDPFCRLVMAEFSIERVQEDTFPDFLFLLEKLAEYEHLDPPDAEARVRLKEDAFRPHPAYEGYLARLGTDPIGFVTFFFTYSTFLARPTLFLEDLFILAPFRGRGYGKQLFSFCRNEAKIRGCGRMDWMVLTWNKPSIQFYEEIGAERSGWHSYRLRQDQF